MNRPISLLRKLRLLTLRRAAASGTVVQATVRLKAAVRGTWGNRITLAKSSGAINPLSATLTGGADYPPGALALDTGATVFPLTGDKWRGQTNALRIIQDVTDSERGRFYARQDGTLVWENRDKLFTVITQTPVATLDAVYAQTQGGMDVDKVYNRIVVTYPPRAELTSGVVAKSPAVITVQPYGTGTPTPRYNANDPFNDPYATVVRLPYVDPATGLKMGAKTLTLPLAAGVDLYVTDTEDGSGFNYTPTTPQDTLGVAVANAGDHAEIQFINRAIGNLYINTLQLRGTGIVDYNPVDFVLEDDDAQVVNQVRSLALGIPLPADLNYIRSLAQYYLARYKIARYRVNALVFGDLDEGVIAGSSTNIFALRLGDLIAVTDAQLGWTANLHRIIGVTAQMRAEKNMQVTLYLSRVDDKTFWMLGNATYGKLGTSTRLAV